MQKEFTYQEIKNRKHFLNYQPLSQFINVENFKDGKDLVVVEIISTEEQIINNEKKTDTFSKKEVIIYKDVLELIENNIDNYHKILENSLKQNRNMYFVFSQEQLLEKKQVVNLRFLKIINPESQKNTQENTSSIFEKIQSSDFKVVEYDRTVRETKYIDLWKDENNQYYLSPIKFDYINGNLSDDKYHLDLFIESLINKDNLAFIIETDKAPKFELLKTPIDPDSEKLGKIIQDVPYYNRDSGSNETINLIYYPTQEDIIKIISFDKNENPNIYDVDSFIIQKILGGEKFLKRPIQEPEPITPKRKFKS